MSLVNIMFRSNRIFCFSENQITYSAAFLVTAWLVIVEGFDLGISDECAEVTFHNHNLNLFVDVVVWKVISKC